MSLSAFLKKRTVELGLIFIVSVGVCLIYTYYIHHSFYVESPDGNLYINMARNFIQGKGLINTIRPYGIIVPPLFSIIISFFLLVFKSLTAFVVFQYIIFGFNAILVYVITERLFGNKFSCVVSVVLLITNYYVIFFGPAYCLTETLFICFILFTVYCLILLIENRKSDKAGGYFFIVVVITTLGILERPQFMLLLPVIIAWALIYLIKGRIKARIFVACVLFPVMLFSINIIYNSVVNREAVFLENYSGINLYTANNEKSSINQYSTSQTKDIVGQLYFQLPDDGRNFGVKNTILRKAAIQYMVIHPRLTLKRIFLKAVNLFASYRPIRLVFMLFFFGAVLTFFFFKEKRNLIIILLSMMLYFVIVTSTGLILIRYAVPILPLYFIFIGGLVAALQRAIKMRKTKKLESPVLGT
jgi:hypothetical protein